jgi:ADP-heptose:LPS heptosyltransferase
MKPIVIIAPFSKKLRNEKANPKNYPYWPELIELLKKKYELVQIGIKGEPELAANVKYDLPMFELQDRLKNCSFWISVDSFLPHLAEHVGKRGVVIWGVSDPLIFGYSTNLNILKDRKYLRPNQFDIWETQEFNKDVFLPAAQVYEQIVKEFPTG